MVKRLNSHRWWSKLPVFGVKQISTMERFLGFRDPPRNPYLGLPCRLPYKVSEEIEADRPWFQLDREIMGIFHQSDWTFHGDLLWVKQEELEFQWIYYDLFKQHLTGKKAFDPPKTGFPCRCSLQPLEILIGKIIGTNFHRKVPWVNLSNGMFHYQ